MSAPGQVRVKRKRNEPAPDTLIVEPQHKRAFTDNTAIQLQYVRQQDVEFNTAEAAEAAFSEENMQRKQQFLQNQPKSDAPAAPKSGRRTFHLARVRVPEGVKKQKKSKEASIATFVEKPASLASAASRDTAKLERNVTTDLQQDSKPLKRPTAAAAVAVKDRQMLPVRAPRGAQPQEHLETLANDLHQFALDELASAPKPKVTALPKLSAARSRDIHRQRSAVVEPRLLDQEMAEDEDSDYVYETYVLAVGGGARAADADANMPKGDVGILIITEDDQSAWEAYIEDEASDKGDDTDEEDENAEHYYGADYPDDELASDDEFDRNAYGYRRNGDSDNEEWDEDTGAYSDDEKEQAVNPWRSKTSSQFAKYLDGKEGNDEA